MERGEKIELLVDKTDRLSKQAFKFESTSRNLRRTLWWKSVRTIVCLTSVIGLLVFILAAGFCGGLDFHKCHSSN